ncbi:diguanylate cyclase (GGDEF)-like protein [Paenibacillus taihuensis]|uniref:Diguanylate cyclase (GGDEF)-like protein n=1 Tax=Paenibacillus taihuensis TaxID=1156355 RepID=A0A3D9RRR7_9BACL|nr:sensor domain-containing diguanylate cyclase [Paenibacillus taihuensis]REE80204.1 diguanylate cyclase (GGDEF)-like protein [Paenibacillus taihuensis]
MNGFSLRGWVISLLIGFMAILVCGIIAISYFVFLSQQEQKALQTNAEIARKLADTMDITLAEMQRQLKAMAARVAINADHTNRIEQTFSLQEQSNFFNSAAYADENGHYVASYPNINIVGKKSSLNDGAYNLREPFISPPFRAITGRLVVVMSVPVVSDDRKFHGNLIGTIYLEGDNIFSRMIGEQSGDADATYRVIDNDGYLLYDPDHDRVGTDSRQDSIAHHFLEGESGSERAVLADGTHTLAGYASITSTGWGVTLQTPDSAIKASALAGAWRLFLFTLPVLVSLLLLARFIIIKLFTPLKQLAAYSYSLSDDDAVLDSIQTIPAWYTEIDQVKRTIGYYAAALEHEVSELKKESLTDKLTGLANRRHIDQVMQQWVDQGRAFAIAILDIDHFKKFNDQYGHSLGDKALRRVAETLQHIAREEDLCGRYGGEEFIILLPEADTDTASIVLEQLHAALKETPVVSGRHVTVSIGVGHYPEHARTPKALYALTDAALYQAKHEGRNRTVQIAQN